MAQRLLIVVVLALAALPPLVSAVNMSWNTEGTNCSTMDYTLDLGDDFCDRRVGLCHTTLATDPGERYMQWMQCGENVCTLWWHEDLGGCGPMENVTCWDTYTSENATTMLAGGCVEITFSEPPWPVGNNTRKMTVRLSAPCSTSASASASAFNSGVIVAGVIAIVALVVVQDLDKA